MDPTPNFALMGVRLALQAGAGFLVARGIGDADMWQVVIAALISGGGAIWSWAATNKLAGRR